MKKFIIAGIILSLFGLLMTGCGSSAGQADSKKNIKVVTYAKWNPFEYVDNGKVVGFDIDLINALAADAGYDCTVQDVGWDPMFVQIKDKSADAAIAGITITDDRRQTYDFSNPYFISRQSIVVKDGSNIQSARDLTDKVVAVQSGSTGQEAVEKLMGKNDEHIKKIKGGLTYIELLHGTAKAVVGDDTANKIFIQENPDEQLKIIEDKENFSPEYFGIMFPKGSDLTVKMNESLQHIINNGKYAEIYQKWFKTAPNLDELKAQQK
ncbi:basic amino acid ABC transporter substrate-binding protein [Pectinatus haikarae]|uniref:Polar amino acid transport system substrate-binding protein n=1 Tax=Pectinatus haikarae TaxID=349096 RepID=A0ABT9YAF2_9FIRM|nr:basic amino acid ABC transporter substrate-binding protein [Pectinatus haikarae]MDQ0204814.1 polar amino acid transport system substrate-binding protein [Pectinatus haikarae]